MQRRMVQSTEFMLVMIYSVVFCLCGTAFPREIWVDWTQELPDANGTENKPYSKINTAIANASITGDVIKVKPGVYKEDVVIDKDLVLSGVSGPDVTLIYGIGNAITINADKEVTVERFTVTSSTENGVCLIKYNTSRNVLIRNILSVGNSKNGLYKNSSDCKARLCCCNCTFVGNSISGAWANAYSTFENCISTDNNSYGFTSPTTNWPRVERSLAAQNKTANYHNVDQFENLSESTQPGYLEFEIGDFRLAQDSPCRHTGKIGTIYLNPDGSRNDIGAYGGPGAEGFYERYGNAPVVRDLHIAPGSAVEEGTTITITATGEAH